MSALSYWRHSHEEPLENARKLLVQESINKDKSAIFAKRLKRHASIVRKLKRFPGMKLKNMQDIGGCRAIVSNKKKLMQIVRELRKKHNFKGSNGSIKHKDYIAEPKEDGYRGYHLIGSFECADGSRKSIELQLRTRLQHNWATTLEIVDLFTGQALKSNQGTKPWTDFFVHTSKQFAAMEDIHLFEALPDLKKKLLYSQVVLTNNDHLESCKQVQVISSKLNIVRKLNAYSNSLRIASDHWKEVGARGYVLLEVNANEGTVKLTLYP
ncbi:MAG: RelA/SpoT domain-containing protein, partial [Pseudomonadota bacterium]